MSDLDLGTVDRLLTTTRSVRKRLDLTRPVPRETILECIRLATQAPTGSNLQRWRWLVVDDPDRRKLVAEAYREGIEPYLDIMTRMFGDSGGAVIDSARYLVEIVADVPALIIPCHLGTYDEQKTLLEGAGYPYEMSANMAASGFYGSVWPAVWSFMLAARSRGLGTTLTTMHLAREHQLGSSLGIPDTVSQVGLIPLAYYTGESFKPAARRPAEEITYWNGWKQT
jgi:nitroreductase